ncbi:MAG: hypothetical protein MI743_06815, partial [Sneathiellales bacterium]|nr:hypothetical protein [Sneathiellales bacterium]
WIFYGAGAYGIFVLRKKMPDVERPFKVPFYPYTPAIFVIFSAIFVISTLYNDIIDYINGETEIITSVFGLLIVSLGIPFYIYFNKKSQTELEG